jgi:hypothetical protein
MSQASYRLGLQGLPDFAASRPLKKVREQMATAETSLVHTEAPGSLSRREDAGLMAIAQMTEGEFKGRLQLLKQGQDRLRTIQQELMTEGEDYGVIPGTKKPTLLKPGAEKLCAIYGLVATFRSEIIEGDGETRPHLRVRTTCFIHKGSDAGPIVAQGEGAANSWERKHRYRQGQRSCPACGVEGSILRSKIEEDGDRGWFCWAKRGGCGAKFLSNAPAITEQQAGEVENKDPYDVENTLVKMALKRAFIDGTLRATATSGLFTQDLEDTAGAPAPDHDEERPKQRRAAQTEAPKASPAEAQATTRDPGADDGDDFHTQPREQAEKRMQSPACPSCKKADHVMISRYPRKGRWFCNSKAGGCGTSFNEEAAR